MGTQARLTRRGHETGREGEGARQVGYWQWAGAEEFADGSLDGVQVRGDRLVIGMPVASRQLAGSSATYDVARWTSPLVTPGFAFTELVASWNTVTPPGTWVEVSVVVICDDGRRSQPYVLGRWAMDGDTITSASVPAQGDDIASVVVDVLAASRRHRLVSWQLTVGLHRRQGMAVTPVVDLVAAMVSALPDERPEWAELVPQLGSGVVLDVPTFSQELHAGRYPHLSGGGESWCSPTATAMVLAYFDAMPAPADYSWVDPSYADPWVVHAATHAYDAAYGAGNWPFNCAYASELGLRAFVTRLRSLDEAETLVHGGVPLVASVSFAHHELTGAGYATEGHLVVIVGFTETGDVIVNDPASHLVASDSEVRTVYGREQFSAAWLGGSAGIVYVIRPRDMALPPPPPQANW